MCIQCVVYRNSHVHTMCCIHAHESTCVYVWPDCATCHVYLECVAYNGTEGDSIMVKRTVIIR